MPAAARWCMKVRFLVGNPFEEPRNLRLSAQFFYIGAHFFQLLIGKVHMQRFVANRVDGNRFSSAPASGHIMMPLDFRTKRSTAKPATFCNKHLPILAASPRHRANPELPCRTSTIHPLSGNCQSCRRRENESPACISSAEVRALGVRE